MISYTAEQYGLAMNLKEQGLGSLRISKIINVPRGTVENWINREAEPYYFSKRRITAVNSTENANRLRKLSKSSQPKACKKSAEIRKKKLPTSAEKLSEELAYILGVIHGDGCVSVKQRRVILSAVDKEFVQEFKNFLEMWSGTTARIYQRSIKTDNKIKNRKPQWVTYMDSISASEFLHNFNINNILNASDNIKCKFLRGLFDSEGSVGKDSIIFYNTNYTLIKLVENLLKSICIESKLNSYVVKSLSGRKINYYRICIYSLNRSKFYNLIGFSILRKQQKLHALINNKREIKMTEETVNQITTKEEVTEEEIVEEKPHDRNVVFIGSKPFMKPLAGNY